MTRFLSRPGCSARPQTPARGSRGPPPPPPHTHRQGNSPITPSLLPRPAARTTLSLPDPLPGRAPWRGRRTPVDRGGWAGPPRLLSLPHSFIHSFHSWSWWALGIQGPHPTAPWVPAEPLARGLCSQSFPRTAWPALVGGGPQEHWPSPGPPLRRHGGRPGIWCELCTEVLALSPRPPPHKPAERMGCRGRGPGHPQSGGHCGLVGPAEAGSRGLSLSRSVAFVFCVRRRCLAEAMKPFSRFLRAVRRSGRHTQPSTEEALCVVPPRNGVSFPPDGCPGGSASFVGN